MAIYGEVDISGGTVNAFGNDGVDVYGSVTVGGGTLETSTNLTMDGGGSLLVDGGHVLGGTWNGSFTVVGASGTGSMLVDGGLVTSAGSTIGFESTGKGTATVTGLGSQWIVSDNLTVGRQGSDNTLIIANEGLVKVGNSSGETIAFSTMSGANNNSLRLADGYIALFGNQTTYIGELIGDGSIQLWNGSAWVTATAEDVDIAYYATDAEGEAATGYSGLGGYTVATGGVQAVPEPGTSALLALGLGALLFRRRMKAA